MKQTFLLFDLLYMKFNLNREFKAYTEEVFFHALPSDMDALVTKVSLHKSWSQEKFKRRLST